MTLINEYAAMCEEELRTTMPEDHARMQRLRTLLSRHPVFNQDACSLISPLFTNGYVSIGRRATGTHTDYRNPAGTHLSRRRLGDWGDDSSAGQLVLFERYLTRGLVVDDRPQGGRQFIGGLNCLRHANIAAARAVGKA